MSSDDDVTDVTPARDEGVPYSHIGRLWLRLSLTSQFLIIAGLIVCSSMAVLGEWLGSQIAASQLQSRAESGALYMEGFLARHLKMGEFGPGVAAEDHLELDEILNDTDLARRVESLRIWRRDGMILYSTDKSLIGKTFPSSNLETAFSGKVVAHLENGHNDEGQHAPSSTTPLIEIYAPIYAPGTRNIIAVGEVYEAAGEFIRRRDAVQRRTWYLVAGTTIAIVGALYIIVRRANNIIVSQRTKLKKQLADAQALARQNRKLREIADKARLDSAASNEVLLNRIGSDIHDGPIQLLSLLIMRLGQKLANSPTSDKSESHAVDTSAHLSPSSIAAQALSQLRDLSTGLVMPEIENLSLEAALRLAVDRHQFTTGSQVGASYSGLPRDVANPLKTCLYRIVQEGLNNAFRHGNGLDQQVAAFADDSSITLIVSDGGPGFHNSKSEKGKLPLGLLGIHNRVDAFKGTLEMQRREGSGTELVVRVPFNGNSH
ncbi:hypothetical protein LP421_32385 (plasmid) [Rhizobium sp. RCAM05350]|nr:hypothetical protein LP421_32385 [Rhizobium sp. RCAM05350]